MKKALSLIILQMISTPSFAAIYDCTNTKNANEYSGNTPVNVAFSTSMFTKSVVDARFSLQGRDEANYEETNCTREKDGVAHCYPLNTQSPVREILFHKVFGAMAIFKNVEGATLLDCLKRYPPVVK